MNQVFAGTVSSPHVSIRVQREADCTRSFIQVNSARKDAILPLSQPIRGLDGSEMENIFVPKDTDIMVGILAVNRDPAIWGEDADQWKPERWLEPLPAQVTEARVPGVYANMYAHSLI